MIRIYKNENYEELENYNYNRIDVNISEDHDRLYMIEYVIYTILFYNLKEKDILDEIYLEAKMPHNDYGYSFDAYLITGEENTGNNQEEYNLIEEIVNGNLKPIKTGLNRYLDGEHEIVPVHLQKLNKKITRSIVHLVLAKPVIECYNEVEGAKEFHPKVEASIVNVSKLPKQSEPEQYSYDSANLFVNKMTGNLITQVDLLSTLNQSMPIGLSMLKKDNEEDNSLVPFGFVMNYQFNIEKEYLSLGGLTGYKQIGYILEDYTGNRQRYFLVNELNENDYQEFLNHNIEYIERYYNEENGSCLYITNDSNENLFMHVFDKNGNQKTLRINDISKPELVYMKNNNGKEVFVNWSNGLLRNFVLGQNSTNAEISLLYTENIISSILYPKLGLRIDITYTSSNISVNYKKLVDGEYETLKVLNLIFVNNRLVELSNSLNDEKLMIQYNNDNKVFTVQFKKSNATLLFDTISYLPNKTTIIDMFDKKRVTIYDEQNRCISKIDNYGNMEAYEYFKNTRYVSNKAMIKCNNLLIENNSFEYLDDNNNIPSWNVEKNGALFSLEKTIKGNCLKIVKTNNNKVTKLSQNIVDTSGKLNKIKFYLKHPNYSYNNVTVQALGTYILNGVVNTFTSIINSWNIDSSDWKQYILNLDVPSSSTFVEVTLNILIEGTYSSTIYLDDFTTNLDESKNTHRNLISNGNMNNYDEYNIPYFWTITNRHNEEKIVENYCYELDTLNGKHSLMLKGDNEEKRAYQIINKKGKANETFVFSMFYKLIETMSSFVPYIIFYDNNEEAEKVEIEVNKIYNEWVPCFKTISTSKKFTSIEVGVKYKGQSVAYVDNFQLIQQVNTTYYSYSENGDINEIRDSLGNSFSVVYDQYNRTKVVISNTGVIYNYYYNSDNTISMIRDSKGNSISYTYDENGYVKSTVYSYQNEMLTELTTNDLDGYQTSLTDEFNSTISCTYDNLKNIVTESLPNALTINKEYTKYNEIKKIHDTTFNTTLAYDDINRNIQEVKCPNGSKYTYEYDSYGRLVNVKLNNTLLVSCNYKNVSGYITNLLSSKSHYYDTNNYQFNYDSKNRLINVRYQTSLLFEFEYDENDNVCKINDWQNNVVKYFEYDVNNNLVHLSVENQYESRYVYDNLNNLKKSNYSFGSKQTSYEYNNKYENNKYTFTQYTKKIINNYNMDVVLGNNRFKGCFGFNYSNVNYSFLNLYDNDIPVYQFNSKNHRVEYIFESANSLLKQKNNHRPNFNYEAFEKEFDTKKYVMLWFKPFILNRKTHLIHVRYSNSTNSIYRIIINELGNIELLTFLSSPNDEYKLMTSASKVKFNEWNMLVFCLETIPDASYIDNEDTRKLHIYFNDEYLWVGDSINSTSIPNIIIGEQSNNQFSSFNVAMIAAGSTLTDFEKLYYDGLVALNNNLVESFDSVNYLKDTKYEIISFNGSLESSRGIEPMILEYEKDKSIFMLDKDNKRYCLSVCNSNKTNLYGYNKIGYDLKMTSVGTISIKFNCFNLDEFPSEIFNFVTSDNIEILKASVINNYLSIMLYGIAYDFNVVDILENTWYTFTIFYTPSSIKIYLNDIYIGEINSNLTINLNNCITLIGGNMTELTFEGMLSELLVYRAGMNPSNYASEAAFLHNSCMVRNINYYDKMDRLLKKETRVKTNVFTNDYIYNKTRIEEEKMYDEYRKYVYDNMNNIIEIWTKENENATYVINKKYTYDKYGKLTKTIDYEKNTETVYGFSNYGVEQIDNIVSKTIKDFNGNTIVTYTFGYPSQNNLYNLAYVTKNGLPITFAYNGHIITSITQNGTTKNITYEGKKIKTYGNNTYYYNEEGVRVKKVTEDGEVHEYIVEGTKILKEKITLSSGSNIEIYYNYNQYGELIGYECDGRNYFYVRDILGTIHKVIDEDGVVVVKYSYDEWGQVDETILSNLNGAKYNPFKYKGYYYDVETQLFYCNSRYYSPELCRWISPDSIEYLDPQSINGLNLYCYCMNNPINKYDPSGHFAISAALFIGTIVVGALIGGGTAAYSSIKKGDEWYEVALKTLSGAALGGMLGAAMGTGAALAAGGTIAGLSVSASVAVGMGVTVGGSAVLGATNSFVNQIIDNDWDISKVSASRIGTDALVAGIKGLLSFGAGAWTGGAGLWNVPKGAAPGFLNAATKIYLNTVIGTGLKLSVDAIYAMLLGEECGWINGLKGVIDWVF